MKRLLLGCIAALVLALPAAAQTNKVGQQLVCDGANANTNTITVKDAAGATQTFDVVTGGTARCATVKAASTAAAATDLGLVVSMSPNGQNVAWAGGTLGAMANYGTSPGAVLVPGMNAFITNVPTVAQATAANLNATVVGTGTFAAQLTGATNNINNVSGTVSLPTGAATSALQGTNTATTAHTCSVAGYSELGCLGQLDDDIKAPIPAGTANIGQVGGSVNITPTDCSIALTTGGTAQNIIAANAAIHGFTIANIDTAAGSGEPIWVSFTTTAAASTIASYPLSAPTATTFAGLSSYTTPMGFGSNANVSVVAATTGHKISCTRW